MKKRILSVAFVLLLILALSVSTLAGESPERFTDGAGLLSGEEARELKALLDELSEHYDFDITVVTVLDLGAASPREYAESWIDNNGFRADGIVLLLDMGGRNYYISPTWGRASEIFTNRSIDYMAEKFVPYLSRGEYAGAFRCFAKLCESYLSAPEAEDELYAGPTSRSRLPGRGWIAAAVGIGVLTALIGTGIMKGKLKSVHKKENAAEYMRRDSLHIRFADERFLYHTVTRTARVRSTSSGGGGHGRSGGGGHF